MTDLKPGWQRVKFGEVVRLNKETCKDPVAAGINRVIGLEHLEPGDLRVRSWADVADGTTFSNRVRPGQVLFGKRRAYQRKVAVADFDAICSGDIYVFESADPKRLLPDLLPFICQAEAFFEYAVGTSAGSLSPRTNWKSLAEYEFALPPLDEQQRISLAARTVTYLRESLYDVERTALVLVEAFCSDLVRSVPSEEQVKVGAIAKFTSGKSIPVSSLPQTQSDVTPIPVYGGNGIAGYTSTPLASVPVPSVVIGRVGQYCGVTTCTWDESWVTDNALYPISISECVSAPYLALALRGRHLNRGKLGEYLPLITQKVLHSILVPVPSLCDQQRDVNCIRELERAFGSICARLREVDVLHQRLLSCLSTTKGIANVVY